jgi:DNA-binding XRE family transcriptional regulator
MFALVLRGYRIRSGLTQEELADKAAISVRGPRNLEAGRVDRPLSTGRQAPEVSR